MSEQHFHYNLIRAGQVPIAQTPARRSWSGPQAISGNSTARKVQAPGTISIRSPAPWLTTRPSHATASGDNTATRQWCLARSRGRLPMPGGPGADLELTFPNGPRLGRWRAHHWRPPHWHGLRQVARHSGDDGALLKILALGNRQIAAGQVKSATDVVGRLQERNQRR